MTDTDVRTYRSVLLETTRRVIRFLDDHGIRYYAEGGTLLGAVRHGGMIPWDDDVDLNVPREDLLRLLSLRKQLNEVGLDILSLQIPGYYQPFAKVINLQTSVWENKSVPFMSGVWVDLFPLDHYDRGAQSYLPDYRRFRNSFASYADGLHRYSFVDLVTPLFRGDLHLFFKQLSQVLYFKPLNEHYKRRFLAVEKALSALSEGVNYVSFTEKGAYVLDAAWYSGTVDLPFEDFSIKAPAGFREYLTFMFGQYMKMPDEPARKSDHDMYYVNLQERMSIADVKKSSQKR